MFELLLEDASDSEGKKLCEQFANFIKQEGLLPYCSIRVHKNMKLPSGFKPVGEIGRINLYHDGEFYYIRYNVSEEESVLVRISSDFRQMEAFYREFSGKYLQSRVAAALYFGYRYLAVSNGCMMIHSAAIVYRGDGILFCGVSGAGKSSQAHLWIRYRNAAMLNADKPCLISKEDRILVHGSPWSGKENVYLNTYAPVKCIVFVEQCLENWIEKISAGDAFSLLYLNNYIYPVNDELENQYIEVVRNISGSVPVYRLRCDLSEQAVKVLYNELYDKEYTLSEKQI